MSDVRWKKPASGDFAKPKGWVGKTVPGAADDAVLDAAGGAFTVTSSSNEIINGIDLAANATLAINGGTFTARAGTDGGVNAGTILVADQGVFDVAGVVKNTGAILLTEPTGTPTLFFTANATLTGGGDIVLGYGGTFADVGLANGVVLTNMDNTISGIGFLGTQDDFTLVNASKGVIQVDQYSPDYLQIGSSQAQAVTITNGGIIEAGLATRAVISIENVVLDGTGGRINAQAGGDVAIESSQISGQILDTLEYGSIYIDKSSIQLGGNIANSGQLDFYSDTVYVVRDIALTGGGTLRVGKGDEWIPASSKMTLTNIDNTIVGVGSLGCAKLTLINDAAGVISGTGERKGGYVMKIDTGSHTIINAGTIRASGGGVIIDSPVDNSGQITGMDGTMTVNGAVTGSGQAGIASSYNEIGRLNFNGSFNENVSFQTTDCELGLAQSQSFTASVTGFSAGGGGDLLDLGDIGFVGAGEATFSGTASGGVLTVTDGTHTANINLLGDYLNSTFVASSDGAGGTNVVAESAQTPSAAHFASAMAAMNGHGGAAGVFDARAVNEGRQMILATPRLAIA